MCPHPAYARSRVLLLASLCSLAVLLVFETGCGGAASPNPSGSQLSKMKGGAVTPASPGVAAYAYVGTNVSGNERGYVINYPISSQGISLSAAGASVSGVSGTLAVTAQFVFATDGRYIVTYTRDANGGLTQTSQVDGTAHNITPDGSIVGPLTVDLTGHTLYAAEIEYDGTDNDAYSSWSINADGTLTFLSNAGPEVNYNTYLSFTQDDHYAYGYGCYFLGWEITALARNSDGTLTAFDSGALPPPNNDFLCPGGVATSALGYAVVPYVDVEQEGSLFQLGSFTENSDGTLTLVADSVIYTPFLGVRSVMFDPSGQYLALSGDRGIQMYSLQPGGLLTPIGSIVDDAVPFNVLRWDNDNHLYGISGAGLYVFTSSAGVLTPVPGTPLPVTEAGSLAVLPAE